MRDELDWVTQKYRFSCGMYVLASLRIFGGCLLTVPASKFEWYDQPGLERIRDA